MSESYSACQASLFAVYIKSRFSFLFLLRKSITESAKGLHPTEGYMNQMVADALYTSLQFLCSTVARFGEAVLVMLLCQCGPSLF